MNSKYKSNPEVIGTLKSINEDGDDTHLGDKVVGIQVQQNRQNRDGLVQFDVRGFKGSTNLILEIELSELVAALSLATMNADRDLE